MIKKIPFIIILLIIILFFAGKIFGQIPFKASALLWLDGSVKKIGTSWYFVDKSGNGRNFLITGIDFDSTNVQKGFPYKSAATISAPSGDATLQANDIDSFFYTSGTPNQIPVVSLFQDIGYDHKIFTRHLIQVLSSDTTEVRQKVVKDIVCYNSFLSGTNLTKCQTYYRVPTEVTGNVIWVTKWGNDATGTGSKAAPVKTIQKAYDLGALYPIYVKSGVYLETNGSGYLAPSRIKAATAIGLVYIKASTSVVQTILSTGTLPITMTGFIIGNTTSPTQTINVTGTGVVTLSRCKIALGGYGIDLKNSPTPTITDCIFTGQTNRLLNSTVSTTITFNNNYSNVNQITLTFVGGTVVAKYNNLYFLSLSSTGTNNCTVFNNKVTSYISASCATKAGSLFYCRRNLVTTGPGINIGSSNFGKADISYNTCTGSSLWDIYEQDTLYVRNNLLIKSDSGNCGMAIKSNTVASKYFEIENNTISVYKAASTPIQIGDEVAPTFYNTYTGIIRRNKVVSTINGAQHGVDVFNHSGVAISQNYIEGYSFGCIVKCNGLDLTNSPITYNISYRNTTGISAKGGKNQLIANNVIVSPDSVGLRIASNNLAGGNTTLNTIFKNNIIVETGVASTYYAINMDDTSTIVSDSNVIYSLNNSNKYGSGSNKTLAQWQALGHDVHSLFTNPNLTAGFYPSTPIVIGANLGTAYRAGIDILSSFGTNAITPIIISKNQPSSGAWQLGAYVQ